MNDRSIAILNTGLVTSVGLSAPATCAAIRAKISNPTETRFIDSNGEWIMAHQVQLEKPWRGRAKLAKMAAMAIEECLEGVERSEWAGIPLLLCVAEKERPGRMEGLDDRLLIDIEDELKTNFGSDSAVFAYGRASFLMAMAGARKLLLEDSHSCVLIATADSLLNWPTLMQFEQEGRLLTAQNSNGFLPGEAGGAVLVSSAESEAQSICAGIGFATELTPLGSDAPSRGTGIAKAIENALADSECAMHELDLRIADISGEQYYFREATLAVSRLLRQRKETFDLWHPAECAGETGAAAGFIMTATAIAAGRKGYLEGSNVLIHLANDSGARAAAVLRAGAIE